MKVMAYTLAELEKKYDDLVSRGMLQEAAQLLEDALDQVPEHFCEVTGALAWTYMELGDFEKGLATYEHGLKRGVFYQLPLRVQEKIPSAYHDHFKKIFEENNRLKEIAQAKAKAQYEVLKPEEYSDRNKYPLCVIFHGGNGSIESAKTYWKSKMLREQFLRVYIQSSEVDSSTGFTWYKRIRKGREEIKECYQEVIAQYPVDTERVIIGGFSVGGSMAIDVVFNCIIPAVGFIGGCPGKPESLTREQVEKAVEQGVRGVMIAGENDYYRHYQREMAEIFEETGFNCQAVVIPGLGHDVPENFSELIDEAITYVMGTS